MASGSSSQKEGEDVEPPGDEIELVTIPVDDSSSEPDPATDGHHNRVYDLEDKNLDDDNRDALQKSEIVVHLTAKGLDNGPVGRPGGEREEVVSVYEESPIDKLDDDQETLRSSVSSKARCAVTTLLERALLLWLILLSIALIMLAATLLIVTQKNQIILATIRDDYVNFSSKFSVTTSRPTATSKTPSLTAGMETVGHRESHSWLCRCQCNHTINLHNLIKKDTDGMGWDCDFSHIHHEHEQWQGHHAEADSTGDKSREGLHWQQLERRHEEHHEIRDELSVQHKGEEKGGQHGRHAEEHERQDDVEIGHEREHKRQHEHEHEDNEDASLHKQQYQAEATHDVEHEESLGIEAQHHGGRAGEGEEDEREVCSCYCNRKPDEGGEDHGLQRRKMHHDNDKHVEGNTKYANGGGHGHGKEHIAPSTSSTVSGILAKLDKECMCECECLEGDNGEECSCDCSCHHDPHTKHMQDGDHLIASTEIAKTQKESDNKAVSDAGSGDEDENRNEKERELCHCCCPKCTHTYLQHHNGQIPVHACECECSCRHE